MSAEHWDIHDPALLLERDLRLAIKRDTVA
jgi:hypothetical protein